MTEHENDSCTCGHFRKFHSAGRCAADRDPTGVVPCRCPKFELSVVVGGPPKADAVNHPAHYGGKENPYEVIKVLEAWFPEGVVPFCICNAIKYLARAGKKGDFIEDVSKARWYVNYVIERSEPKK